MSDHDDMCLFPETCDRNRKRIEELEALTRVCDKNWYGDKEAREHIEKLEGSYAACTKYVRQLKDRCVELQEQIKFLKRTEK